MLKPIVDTSMRRRGIVVALAAALIVYGLWTAWQAPLDVFPDFVQPQAVIQTEAPGLAPELVETLVTRPVETAVAGVPWLEAVRSQSIQGLSIVTAIFREGTDILAARNLLSEQMATVAERLPEGVASPKLTPLTSSTMDLLKLGLVSDSKSPMELRDFAEWVLAPRLRAVPGVADVGVMGGEQRQLQVEVNPERLMAAGVGLQEVIDAARAATAVRGTGYIETQNQRITVQAGGGLTAGSLAACPITSGRGGNLRIGDVARVSVAPAPKFGDALIQGRPGVLLKALGQYGSNTMEVTRSLEAALADSAPLLAAEGVKVFPRMHRPATYIETSLHHVRRSLLIGGVLVVAVLMLFLFNLRTAFISIVAIPLSLLTAIIVLEALGQSLNTITLGGLAIAIGEVVDDAIIDVENIFRRLRENRTASPPRGAFEVVLDASMEVRGAVVYATLVVVLAFVPVLTMTGLVGRMFAPLGMAYILAILASLAVALTLTPALALILLPRAAGQAREAFFLSWLKRGYARTMGLLINRPRTLITGALVLLAGTLVVGRGLGAEFLPEFREGHFVLQVNAAPGASLPEMRRMGEAITRRLLTEITAEGRPVIDTVEQQIGRAELGEDPWGVNRCEFHLELQPGGSGADQARIQNQIRELLEGYPGITSEVLTFLGDRISETITGETAAVVVNLFGDDLDLLDSQAREVAAVMSALPGAVDVRVASPPGSPQVLASLRPERLAMLGFRPAEVLGAMEVAYAGIVVGQAHEAARSYDVAVTLDPAARRDPEQIGGLLLRSQSGSCVRLDELADVQPRTGRAMILHDGARRRQAVTCNVRGQDLAGFVNAARTAVAGMHFKPGVYPVFAGTAEERAASSRELMVHSLLAGLGVLLLLAMVFGRWQNLMLVLTNLPFALVGGVIAVGRTGATLSMGSLGGFVTLFGITMRNSVMMISHYEHLVRIEGQAWGPAVAIRGAGERIVPVLMTALVTALGLLPIAMGAGEVGREIEGPMAIVILCGLETSTALHLLILPPLALAIGRFEQAT